MLNISLDNHYGVIVIGAGHAGIESALAASRMGVKTAVFTINLSSVGNCPCSPSIGGAAKGTLVREIDALGGQMAKITDECFIHSKILGKGKGPAAWSLRAQIDRDKYRITSKKILESQKNLHLRQAEIINLSKFDECWMLETRSGICYFSKSIIIASGTYLDSLIHIGQCSYKSGPDGIFHALFLSNVFTKLGIKIKKFKTGTPARILKSSINFDKLEIQYGDEIVTPFSYDTENIGENKQVCHIAWTNSDTKRIILENIEKSPMYNGKIKSIGPRYCPSIEDKMVKFSKKERHQIFVEPCGLNTEEIYLHGTSSCLPEEVQIKFYRSILGFENSILMRPAYAIEYDIIDPTQLNHSLEFKNFKGLFSAGQVNGTSGYEEAAAQGIVAGINAALYFFNKDKMILSRSSSYIGTLIDDLIFKGVKDPYRIMTSRSEYRLFLRLDNADERLMPIGKEVGLLSDDSWGKFQDRMLKKDKEIDRIKKYIIKPNDLLNENLSNFNISQINESLSFYDFLKRPEVNYDDLRKINNDIIKIPDNLSDDIFKRIEIFVKYEGYIKKQIKQIKKSKKMENKKIPENIDYYKIKNLSFEAREKLIKFRPTTLAQASSISGVNPSDISILMVNIENKI